MTNPKLLLPLRIPELGPYLGKVITGSGRDPGGLGLDAARYRLATRIFECAGEARRLATREERQAAVAAVGHAAWLEAWEEVVGGVTDLLLERVADRLAAEARAARLSRRLRRRVELGPGEKRAVAARLGSAGAGLVPALDDLESLGSAALEATAMERLAVEAWQDSLKTAARRLEAAWLALEDAIEAELRQWERAADEIASRRKPIWPVLVVGLLALAAAVWLGLVLGGFLDPPSWFAQLWQTVFPR